MSAIENQPDLVATMEKVGIQGWISKPVGPGEAARKISEIVGSGQKKTGTTKEAENAKEGSNG